MDTSLIEHGARDLDQLLFKEINHTKEDGPGLTLTAVMMSPWTRPGDSTVIDGEN